MAQLTKLTYVFTGDHSITRYDVLANNSKIATLTFENGSYIGTIMVKDQPKKLAFGTHATLVEAIISTAKWVWTGHKFTDPVAVPGKTKEEVIVRLEKGKTSADERLAKFDAGRAENQAWKFATKYA